MYACEPGHFRHHLFICRRFAARWENRSKVVGRSGGSYIGFMYFFFTSSPTYARRAPPPPPPCAS